MCLLQSKIISGKHFESIDVDEALKKNRKPIVNINERTDFAAQLEEIESRVGGEEIEQAEIDEDDIKGIFS